MWDIITLCNLLKAGCTEVGPLSSAMSAERGQEEMALNRSDSDKILEDNFFTVWVVGHWIRLHRGDSHHPGGVCHGELALGHGSGVTVTVLGGWLH